MHKQSAEELLGTDDPVIQRAVGQGAAVIRDIKSKIRYDSDNEMDDEQLDP
jgi:hypothetical protein